jgi:hypothetical protein
MSGVVVCGSDVWENRNELGSTLVTQGWQNRGDRVGSLGVVLNCKGLTEVWGRDGLSWVVEGCQRSARELEGG